jgi:Uma2 family endonuclease
VDGQTLEDWAEWAAGLPLGGEGEPLPLLGSRYVAEHLWVRDRLRDALASAVSQGGLGKCFGPRFGMWIGAEVFTPDLLVLSDVQLAENPCYDRFVRGAAMLVVEVMLPEWTEIDLEMRQQYYQRSGVLHYWTVDLAERAMQFWRWTEAGYELGVLDGDGSYRGLAGLTVTPELLWVEESGYPL